MDSLLFPDSHLLNLIVKAGERLLLNVAQHSLQKAVRQWFDQHGDGYDGGQ